MSQVKHGRLFVMLGTKCNFLCAHCMVNASPSANKFDLQESNIADLAETINNTPEIDAVHFTGGEPTLYLNSMIALQKAVTRDIVWGMTTNGSFARETTNFFSKITMNEIVISYDKFHSPFISVQEIKALITELQARNIAVSVHAVYEKIEDLALCSEISGVKPIISELEAVGRANTLFTPCTAVATVAGLQKKCPSCSSTEKKTLFVPQKGYTPCCGSLVWDNLGNDTDLFATKYLDQCFLGLQLESGNFNQIFSNLGLAVPKNASFNTPCKACKFLFSQKSSQSLPSLARLASQSIYPATFSCTEILSPMDIESLSKRFALKYVFCSKKLAPSFTKIKDPIATLNQCGINVTDKPPHLKAPLEFFSNNFISQYTNVLHADEIKSQLNQFDIVMNGPWHKQYYVSDNKIVGMFLAGYVDGKTLPDIRTFHILYIGYAKANLSEIAAKAIRANMVESLKEWNTEELPVTSVVHSFNSASLRFSFRLGLKPILLRLSEQPNE